jgi:hypothetical protein
MAHPLRRPHLIETTARPPRCASAAPDAQLDIKHLGLRTEPEPEQEVRREQRDVIAGGAIDLRDVQGAMHRSDEGDLLLMATLC